MKKLWIAALALFSLAQPVHAEVREILREGAWAMHAGQTDRGRPVCAMSTQGPGQRVFLFQYTRGDRFPAIRMHAPSWQFPEGEAVPVRLISRDQQMVLMGISERNGVRVPLPQGGTTSLEMMLRTDVPIRVDAPTAEPHAWILPTTGANVVVERMVECIEAMATQNPPSTPPRQEQPYMGTGPTLRT